MSNNDEESIKLREDQIEILADAKSIWRRDEEPTVVAQSAVDAVRDALSTSLIEQNGLREETVDRMDLEALGAQFAPGDDGDEVAPVVSPLDMNPETGGAETETEAAADDQEEDDDEFEYESLSHAQLNDMYSDIRKSAIMKQRGIPNRSEEILEEVADKYDCSPDKLPDKDEIQDLLGN